MNEERLKEVLEYILSQRNGCDVKATIERKTKDVQVQEL